MVFAFVILLIADMISERSLLVIVLGNYEQHESTHSIHYILPEPCRIEGRNFKCANFLAIIVLQQPDGKVKFDVYYKETNVHDYLLFDSHHL